MPIPRFAKTTAFQLAIVYTGLFAVSSSLIIAFIFWSTVGYIERQTSETIDAEIQGLAEQYERRGLTGLVEIVAERVDRDPNGRSVYLFVDKDLRPLAGNLERWPSGLSVEGGWAEFSRDQAGTRVPIRARVLGIRPNLVLLVGRDIRDLISIQRIFRRAVVVGVGVTLVLALFGGAAVGLGSRRRIAEINRMARRIATGNFTDRIPLIGGHDEYDDLIENLNRMFGQIHQLLEGMRHVGDSIAHDLRTPLTRLRARLELLLQSGKAGPEELAHCLGEADRLLATFAAILRISRLESGAYRVYFSDTDVVALLRDICDLYSAVAEECGADLRFEVARDDLQQFRLPADRELLAQALTNIVDNAVKYCGKPGKVLVRVSSGPAGIDITVADNGPGIAAADRGRVTERFVRLDAARDLPGTGLGLTLAKAVVDAHGGTLRFDDSRPGRVVSIHLPYQSASVSASAG